MILKLRNKIENFKNQFLEKMTKLLIWIYVPKLKINDLLWFLYIDILLDFKFSRQKLLYSFNFW